MEIIVFLLLAAFLGLIPSAIAKQKGHDPNLWWLFGAALFIIALPCALLLKPVHGAIEAQQRAAGMKKCPACAEMVQGEAIKCRYCGTELQPVPYFVGNVSLRPVASVRIAPTSAAARRRKLLAGIAGSVLIAAIAIKLVERGETGVVAAQPAVDSFPRPVRIVSTPSAPKRRTRGKVLAQTRESVVDSAGNAASTNTDQPYLEFQVEKQVQQVPGTGNLRYPDMLRSANVEGEVLAQFVVDADGLYEAGSFKVLKSSHELFTQAVKNALPEMRFYAAELGGKRVKQLTQQSFTFSLSK
jgi:hypothetical protein